MFGQRHKQEKREHHHPHGGFSGRGERRGCRGGRGGKGMPEGRGGRGGRGCKMGLRGYDMPEQDARQEMQAQAPQGAPRGMEAEQPGVCPICKNHCPLSDPGCDKGKAYAFSMQSGAEEKINV